MKKLIVCLLFVFICFHYQSLYSQNKELFFELTSEKTVYSEQEEIIINYKLVNKSKGKITFDDICVFGCGFDSELILTDDKGVIYKYHGLMLDCINFVISLKPGDEIIFEHELLGGFGSEKPVLQKNYLKEGRYTLTMAPKKCNGIDVNSSELKFGIKKPSAQDGYDILKSTLTLQDNSKKADGLKDFINNYSGSAYLFIAFDEYLKLFKMIENNKHEMNDIFKFYLSKKYESWDVRKNVYDIANVITWLKGEERMINFLAYIIKNYPGSKAGKTAKEILQREIPNEFYIKMLIN